MLLKRKATIFFIFLIINAIGVVSQKSTLGDLSFIEVEEGISKRPIYDISQDKDGFIPERQNVGRN